MGGRGSSSGISEKGKKYGTEHTTLYKSGNIKFVIYNDSTAAKTPLETMTKGRVYVTVNSEHKLYAITYYDGDNKRVKQIDLTHEHRNIKPHTHHGYNHNEKDGQKGASRLTEKEKAMVDRVKRIWYNERNR